MFSAHPKSKPEDHPAADHASLDTPCAEGRLGKTNFIHYLSQPSRSTKLFKRGEVINSRIHHTAIFVGSNVFMIGGQSSLDNSTASLQTTLLVMDSSMLVVNEQKSTKVSVAGHGAVPISDSKALILFGEKSIAPFMLADPVQQIDVKTGDISSFNIKGTAPSARYAHTVALVDNKVYIIGGTNATNVFGDISYIDLSSNSWNMINIPRQAIAGHSTAVVGKYLVTCFGFDNKFQLQNGCNVFDTINNVYVNSRISGNPPTPRSYSSMVTNDNGDKVVYIFGGLDKSSRGFNDLYTLNATNLPNLTWSPVSLSAKSNQGLIPSPRGAHSAVMRSGIMIVWGGYSGTTLSDAEAHFYDFKANAWVDSKTASTVLASNNSTSNRPSLGIIIGVVIAGVIVIIGIISFFIMRKCRSRKVLDDCEVQNDPYIRPGGQLGSNLDLPTNDEDKKTQTKDMSTFEPITLESIPPPSTPLNQLQSQGEKEPKQSNPGSMVSTDLQFSLNMPLSKKQIKHMSTESQRIKRTHKRTSSVSLSRADLESIRPRSFVYHKSSLSASSINSSTNRSSCAFDSIPSGNSESTSITSLDSPTSDKSNRCDSRATSRSVTSMQWVGFNSKMIDERDKERFSLHVRNASYRKSTISEDDGYVIRGDYINTAANFADRRSYSGDFMNYEDVTPTYDPQKRRSALRSSPGRSCISVIPEKEDFTEDVRNRGVVDGIISSGNDTREDSIVDKHANQTHYPSQNLDDSSESPVCNEDDEVGSRKSKRSSKRTSRVSFALKDEKIEFDETESSKSVSFARVSGRTSSQGSESSSGTPSIIEEEEDGGFPNSVTPKASDLNLESLRLYKSEDEFDSIDTRFSLSMFDIGKDQSKTHDTASKVPAPPVERVESQEVRHSIKELMIDQGVLWALQDVE